MRSDLEHLRSVFMAVENGDLGMLKSLGIKDSELGDVKFFLEKLVNTGFLDWVAPELLSPFYYSVPIGPQFYSYLGFDRYNNWEAYGFTFPLYVFYNFSLLMHYSWRLELQMMLEPIARERSHRWCEAKWKSFDFRVLDGNLTRREINIFYNWHDDKKFRISITFSQRANHGNASTSTAEREPAALWESFRTIVLECDIAVSLRRRYILISAWEIALINNAAIQTAISININFPWTLRIDFHLSSDYIYEFWLITLVAMSSACPGSAFRLVCLIVFVVWTFFKTFIWFNKIF